MKESNSSYDLKFELEILVSGISKEQVEQEFEGVYKELLDNTNDPAIAGVVLQYLSKNKVYIGTGWLRNFRANRLPSVKHGQLRYRKGKLVVDIESLGNINDFSINLIHELFQCLIANRPMEIEVLRSCLKYGIPELIIKKESIDEVKDKNVVKWFNDFMNIDPPVYIYSRDKIIQVRWTLRRFVRLTMMEAIALCHWTEIVPMLTALRTISLTFRSPVLTYFYNKVIRDFIIQYLGPIA